MKILPYLLILILLVSCSQKGDITVQNAAGPNLQVDINGAFYILDDGEFVTREINIGRKFIFGPDDKDVIIEGEGDCKFPYYMVVRIRNDEHRIITIYGDAGYIEVCNETSYPLSLYLADCSSSYWGQEIDVIPSGYCSTWMVESICWDMMVESSEGSLEYYDIYVDPCSDLSYTILPPALASSSKESRKLPYGEDKSYRGRVKFIEKHPTDRQKPTR